MDDAERNRRTLVCMAAYGEAEKYLKLTAGPARDYAASIGADFLIHTRPCGMPGSPRLQKYGPSIAAATAGYDYALQLDADVVIRRGAPDVFAFFDPECQGVMACRSTGGEAVWFRQKQAKLIREHLLPKFDDAYYVNTGVLLHRPDALLKVLSRYSALVRRWQSDSDQAYFAPSLQLAGVKPAILDPGWNVDLRTVSPEIAAQDPSNYFFHAAGVDKMSVMRRAAEALGQTDQIV